MQLHLEGSQELKLDPATAYSRLTNLGLMTRALPDAEDVKMIDDETAEATVKLRIALVSTRLNMRVKVLGKKPPTHAELLAEGSGSGSHVKLSSVFDLEPRTASTTMMSWSANAEIGGVMAGIGSAMLKGFAQRKVAEIFEAISRAIEK